MFLQKFYCLIIATLLLFGLNIQNVLATDCDILLNALTSLSTKLKKDIESNANCCQSTGITCNHQNQITAINFSNVDNYNMDLNQFFAELAKLKQLSIITINDSHMFDAQIPETIGNLTNLEKLVLSSNLIKGNLPSSFSKLTKLTYLDLSSNRITGNLPSSLSKLTKLSYLNLDGNYIEGYIPYEYKNLNNLEELHLNGNYNLKGYVPLLPAIKTCDYELTNLCNLNSSKCNSNRYKCIKEDIDETNANNGYPNSDSSEFDNEISSSRYSSSYSSTDGSTKGSTNGSSAKKMVLIYILIICIVSIALLLKPCWGRLKPKNKHPNHTTFKNKYPNQTTFTTKNNVINNTSTTFAPYLDGNVSSATPAYNYNMAVPTPVYNPAVGSHPPPVDPNVSSIYNPPIPPPVDPNVSSIYNPPLPPTAPNVSAVYNPYYPTPINYPENTSYQVANPSYSDSTQDTKPSHLAPAQGPNTSPSTGTSSEKTGNPYENVATTFEVIPPYSAVANPHETVPTIAPQTANAPYGIAPQAPSAPYGH